MLCSVSFLHSAMLMHWNISNNNLFINSNLEIVFCDIGSASFCQRAGIDKMMVGSGSNQGISNCSTDQEVSTDSSGESKRNNKQQIK